MLKKQSAKRQIGQVARTPTSQIVARTAKSRVSSSQMRRIPNRASRAQRVETQRAPSPFNPPTGPSLGDPVGFIQGRLVFDQRVADQTVDIDEAFFGWLGAPDVLEVFWYVDGLSGSPAVNLTLAHSPDGVNWRASGTWGQEDPITANTLYRNDNIGDPLHSGLRKLEIDLGGGGSGGAARVRVWVTSRGMGCRRFSELVFDEQVSSNDEELYTDTRLALLLGSADALQLFVVATNAVTGGVPPLLTVQIEESPDGISWQNKQVTPEINAEPLYLDRPTRLLGEDGGAIPTAAYVRLRVIMTGVDCEARVCIYATGRGQ